jgi:Icc protein
MAVRILQLTDLHLFTDPTATIRDVCTHDSLSRVLDHVRSLGAEFDHVVISGDLAHDEQLATYELLDELLSEWRSKLCVIPGNHDHRDFIRKVFPDSIVPGNDTINFSIQTEAWRLIGLDSHIPGKVSGELGKYQLAWLENELFEHSTQPTMLFVHHPPISVGSSWLDEIGMSDAEQLLELLALFAQVEVVCTGHIHQQLETKRNGIDFLTTPSTGVQFTPQQSQLEVDSIPAGFRTIAIDGDQWQSKVERLQLDS